MTCSMYNYDLGSNNMQKKKSLNSALLVRAECSMRFVYELPPFREKDFPIYFFPIFIFPNCAQFYGAFTFQKSCE